MIDSFDPGGNDNPFQLQLEQLGRIDEICICFERELRNGQDVCIENELHKIVETDLGRDVDRFRSALLYELMLVEIEYRSETKNDSTKAEFVARFPNEQAVVERVYSRENGSSSNGNSNDDLGREFPASEVELKSTFQLSRFHARGGLGVIYVARDARHDRDVAVKFSRKRKPDSNEQFRLAREAAITGRLEHPGIVPVYATQTDSDELPCFVMQLVDGITLRSAVKEFHQTEFSSGDLKFRSRQFRQLVRRIISVAETVSYAHGQGVVHRDIKPANIMLGKFGKTILLDWGLAKVKGDDFDFDTPGSLERLDSGTWKNVGSETIPGQPMGTPEFASPEQVLGATELHNEKSDIYSLGATLYFLLTGTRPLNVKNQPIDRESYLAIAPPRQLDSNISRQLDAICRKAMAVSQADRYPAVTDFTDDLERFLADEPVSVLGEPLLVRARRWAKQRPIIVSAVIASLFVAMLSLAVGWGIVSQKNTQLSKSNTMLTDSNKQLGNAIADANESKSQAMKMLRELTDGGMIKAMARRDRLDSDDRLYLEKVLRKYKAFSEAKRSDFEGIAIRAEGFFRVGQVYSVLGQKTEAKDAFANANRLFDSIDVSTIPDTAIMSARSKNQLGLVLFELGDHVAGEKEIWKAHEQLEFLSGAHSMIPELKRELATTYSNLASIYAGMGKVDSSIDQGKVAVSLLQELIEVDNEDPIILHSLAGVRSNLGLMYSMQNKADLAIKEFNSAYSIETELVKKYPHRPGLLRYQANICTNLGNIYFDQRQYDQAERFVKQAISHNQQLGKQIPGSSDVAHHLGQNYFSLARINNVRGEQDECQTAYLLAAEQAKQAIAVSPKSSQYQQSLFNIRFNHGLAHSGVKDFEEAVQRFEDAIVTAEGLISLGDNRQHRRNMARSLFYCARHLLRQGRVKDALESFDKASKVFVGQAEINNVRDDCRRLHREIHRMYAQALAVAGRLDDAVPIWKTAIELSDDNATLDKTILAVCLAKSNPKQAIAECVLLEKVKTLKPNEKFNIASALAMASRTLESEDKQSAQTSALSWLNQAGEAGFFDDASAKENLKTNASFVELQESDDFKKWVD